MNARLVSCIQVSFYGCSWLLLFGLAVPIHSADASYPIVDESKCLRFSMLVDEQSTPIKIYRDSSISNKFYYLVERPRLLWKSETEAMSVPKLQMLKYQVPIDMSKQATLKEGALLRFTLRVDLPQDVLKQLKEKIAWELPQLKTPVQLDRLPMRNLIVALFGQDSTEVVHRQDSLISSCEVSDSIPFSTNLVRTEASIIESLLGSGSGLPVSYIFDVEGVQQQAGFSLWVDWGKLLESIGDAPKDLGIKHWKVDSWLPLSEQQQGIRRIIQSLVQLQCARVTRDGIAIKELDTIHRWELAGPAVLQIREELFGQSRKFPRPKDRPSEDSDRQIILKTNSESFDAEIFEGGTDDLRLDGERVALLRKTKSHFDMESDQVSKSTLAVAGFITLREFMELNPDGRNKIVSWLRRDKWSSAYFYLPQLASRDSGIQEVDLTISLTDQSKQKFLNAKTARWVSNEFSQGTWEVDGREGSDVWFDLLPLAREFGKEFRRSVVFKVETNIRTEWGDEVFGVDYLPLFSGEVPIASPLNSFSQIEIDGGNLSVDTRTSKNWRVEISVPGQREVKTLNQESIAAKFLVHNSRLNSEVLTVDYYPDGSTATGRQAFDLRNPLIVLDWSAKQTGLK